MIESLSSGGDEAPPDPGRADSLDEVARTLRILKVWAGDPSYDTIKNRINAACRAAHPAGPVIARRTTVADCFRTGRRRVNADLLIAVVQALHPDVGYVAQWRQALRVVSGEARAASQVRVYDTLPPDLPGFIGRATALRRLRQALDPGAHGGVVVLALHGMAGVGKTQLAVHAAHARHREEPFDRILFVNLRGFHPDPTQPPADPSSVLEGFLRLLGVAGQQIPHGLTARAATYRRLLAGTRTLVVLDNAGDAEQARPLLTDTPGCPVLITSRRDLRELPHTTHVAVDLFTPDESAALLAVGGSHLPGGPDPHATARIAHRCGHLPLALGLVTAHISGTSGWTLTDHADRLDERHHQQRLDLSVELAFDLSYRHLPADRRRLLRLVAAHPGDDFDAPAAAALAGISTCEARAHLRHLHRDHLLHHAAPGRYALHDLVRAYATSRCGDEDPPPERRAALTRLFDYYLAGTLAAVDVLYPAGSHRRVPSNGGTVAAPADPDTARRWLDTERPTLVAVAAHAAAHGWPTHAAHLSAALFQYLHGGHPTDALVIHEHARHAACRAGDPVEQAHASTSLGATYTQLGRYASAAEHLQRARVLFRGTGDRVGEARALINLGVIESQLGRNRPAADNYRHALLLFRQAGHRAGEAHALNNLGEVEAQLGEYGPATKHVQQSLALFRQLGGRASEAWTLNTLGDVDIRRGRHAAARSHLWQALTLYRQLGNRTGEAWTLNSLGTLHTRLGQRTDHHQLALDIFRQTGERYGEASALNGIAEAARLAGEPADALRHHTAAHTVAVDIGAHQEHARAHAGLGHVHRALGAPASARQHFQRAVTLYRDLDMPEAAQMIVHLGARDDDAEHGDRTVALTMSAWSCR
ncbi:tetratricopeptide repeat protein [Micromonospora sp. RP3T]|uniref:tetratricopeptide repeat protein n=1 Tax=Micromonospora sp. RP3T TaxID=2135446 RepID=UPI001E52AC8A|nr:tetratricopeptide repeat protein [Micromonospora sp. RP3T]